MSTRTKYRAVATPTNSVLLKIQEGPKEIAVHLSPNQARDLASRMTMCVVELEIRQKARP